MKQRDWGRTWGQNAFGLTVAYVVMDGLCAALGMGVPFACILLGFPVGMFAAMRAECFTAFPGAAMRRALRYAFVTSGITFVIMAGVWGPAVRFLFHPKVDPGSMGLPLILYDPLASFIGWLVLMIVVSPALQFVVTLFGAYVAFTLRLGPGRGGSRRWRALRERPAAGPGIVFFKSRQYEAVRRFYRDELGLGVWLEQADCTIFRHGNLLFGFCDREESDTGGIITLCFADRAAVDRLHERFRDRALGPPGLNEKYRIYQCFIRDPEGRLVEFQQFLDPVPDV